MIFSLTFSIQDISMFLTFRFCRDWAFRAMKTQTDKGFPICHRKFLFNSVWIRSKLTDSFGFGSTTLVLWSPKNGEATDTDSTGPDFLLNF
jgi:hypothetical protein